MIDVNWIDIEGTKAKGLWYEQLVSEYIAYYKHYFDLGFNQQKRASTNRRNATRIFAFIVLGILFLPVVLIWFGLMEMISDFFDFWRHLLPRF